MKKRYLAFLMSIFMLLNIGCKQAETETKEETIEVQEEMIEEPIEETVVIEEPDEKDIVISAIGDCTLGTDTNFGYERSLPAVLDSQDRDFGYFFSGVYDILSNDDLTIANLETTFTNATERAEKTFNFKGDMDYANILTEGSVEVVNLANNHTHDYKEKGYFDTIASLNEVGIPYFGYQDYTILNIDGIKIGLAGLPGWNEETAKAETEKAISYLKEQKADLTIMTYHWGIEREYKQNTTQENIARHAVELGADLVIGHHPHVVQGIECYQGKYIVYSLGNFVFGGNKNPKDKDTMIFRQTFHYEDDVLTDTTIEIIPCSLSGKTDSNDYRPIVLEGEQKEKVYEKIMKYSANIE